MECLIGTRKYHSMELTGNASSAHLSRRRNTLSMLVSVIMCVMLCLDAFNGMLDRHKKTSFNGIDWYSQDMK